MSLQLLKCGRLFRRSILLEESQRYLSGGTAILWKEHGARVDSTKTTSKHSTFSKDVDVSEKNLAFDKNPDRFGTLSSDRMMRQAIDELPEEEDDVKEVEYIDGKPGKTRLKPINYAMIIKKFLKEKKLADALAFLDETMLEKHKAKPDLYVYNLLISGCAKHGYTKKAFQLFNQMKKRGLRPRLSTYTSLFNACSQGPWANDALERARRLRELMIEKGVEPNAIVYNSMIKAFGRHGDLETSFSIMDEMISKNIPIDSVTFNFLLQASASDKEAGFRHALLVWRKMLEKKILPTVYTFNLLLRCTRDCGAGDAKSTEELISLLAPFQKELIEGDSKSEIQLPESKALQTPNLLLPSPQYGSLLSVSSNLRKPWHRLMLLGDLNGLFQTMDMCKAPPDIKTFTLLLGIIPPSDELEQKLLQLMKKRKIPLDIDFCNILIKKRNSSSRFSPALDVISLMKEEKLVPNIVTYGVLAMGCNTLQSAKQLVKDITDNGFRVNIEILSVFLTRAKVSIDIQMVLFVINTLLSENIEPDQKFYQNLVYFKDIALLNLDLKENNQPYVPGIDLPGFNEKFLKFVGLMEDIKNKVKDPSSIHPWEQFKVKAKAEFTKRGSHSSRRPTQEFLFFVIPHCEGQVETTLH